MYICSCHAVTDGQIRKAVDGGISRWKDLVHVLHCSTQCGICGKEAKSLFEKLLQERLEREKAIKPQVVDGSETACSSSSAGPACSACPKRATSAIVTATTEPAK
ncbi:MAG TPA: (2Fe-2S)-binding protein [Oculatellaceae cyanobacterium]